MANTPPSLIQSALNAGLNFLDLCRILRAEGVSLSEQNPRFREISAELQNLIDAGDALYTPSDLQIPISPPDVSLVEAGVLHPGDPRISQILNFGQQALRDLKQALKAGTYRKHFPVGTRIPDIWANPQTGIMYSMPLIVVDYRMVKTLGYGDCMGAILLRLNASPNQLIFDVDNKNVFSQSSLNNYLSGRTNSQAYLYGCSTNLLHSITDVLVDGAFVRFFPPSLEELHLDSYGNPDLEQLVWEYFRDTPTDVDTPCSKRVFCGPSGAAQFCWLRSARRGYANCVWLATTDGSAYYIFAHSTLACAPACVVVAD